MKTLRSVVARIPLAGSWAKRVYRKWTKYEPDPFSDSKGYWEQRYRSGGTSGAGSYGKLAAFKAEVINGFVQAHAIDSVIEFGCGDGNQLRLARYPKYLGLDVSLAAVATCQEKFAEDKTKFFQSASEWTGEKADLALSLDVIYHLIEDAVFERHMTDLFCAADRYVIIYSSDHDEPDTGVAHVRHRAFTKWVHENAPQWVLLEHIPNRYSHASDPVNGSFCDFYIFGSNRR